MHRISVECPHCYELSVRIEELERLLGLKEVAPREFRFTATEEGIFGALMRRERCSKEFLMEAVYGAMANPPENQIALVWVCKIRKKVAPFGVVIETLWGRGWRIPPASKTVVAAMLDSQRMAA